MDSAVRAGCVVLTAVILSAQAASAQNYVEFFIERANDASEPSLVFSVEVEIVLPNVPGVTDVSVMVDATVLTVEPFDNDWEVDVDVTSLADLQTALDGTWTISISGSTPSVSTFTFDASQLREANFFATPSIVSPSHQAPGVALKPTFSWTDPTGVATPYVVGVEVDRERSGGGFLQEELSPPFGVLPVDAISWTPPQVLDPGLNSLFVFYDNVNSSFVTPLDVSSGTIVWSNSPFAPTAAPFGPWPLSTPLLVLGSFAKIQFTTAPLVEDFEAYAIQTDTTGSGGEFFVTTTGNPSDPVVASVGESLAGSTGIADDAGNKVWVLGSQSGNTGVIDSLGGFLMIGDIPPSPSAASKVGLLSDYFAVERNLIDGRIRARLRESGAFTDATQFRFLLADASDNEAATPLRHLGTNLTEFESSISEFNGLQSNAGNFDVFQVTGLGIEFFSDPAVSTAVPTLLFHVDDLEIVPEPSAEALGLAVIGAVSALAARRRSTRPATAICLFLRNRPKARRAHG